MHNLTSDEWAIVRVALLRQMGEMMRTMRYTRPDNLKTMQVRYDRIRELYVKLGGEDNELEA